MRKLMTTVALMALTAVLAIGGTLAYLTAETPSIVNRFQFGSVGVELAEPSWDLQIEDEDTPLAVLPGQEVDKDPTVTVCGTENVWVYVQVENNLTVTETVDGQPVTKEMVSIGAINNGWSLLDGTTNVYKYADKVNGANGVADPETGEVKCKITTPVFSKVTVSEDITMEWLNEYGTTLFNQNGIKVKAFVHQAEAIEAGEVDQLARVHFGFPRLEAPAAND